MKTHLKNIGIFAALLVVIMAAAPRQKQQFQYHFEIGKPWGYELITAEFDFPIYKTSTQLNSEYAEVLQDYTPYYRMQDSISQAQIVAVEQVPAYSNLSASQQQVLKNELQKIYSTGILSAQELENNMRNEYHSMSVVKGQTSMAVSLDSVYTPRTAYSHLLSLGNKRMANRLRELDLNRYLVPNLEYDTLLSERMHDNLLGSVSLTEGMVQKGEKIIDKGEIINPATYQILVSLRQAFEDKEITSDHNIYSIIGEILLIAYFILMLIVYLNVFRYSIYKETRNIIFLCMLIGVVVVLTCLIMRFTSYSIYLVPVLWVSVLVRVFYDSRTALFMHIITVMMLSLIVPAPFEFVLLQMAAGMGAVGVMKDITQRSQLASAALVVFSAYAVVYSALAITTSGSFLSIDPWMYLYFFINALLIIGAYGMVYVVEKTFGFVSSITLVELTNVNSTLMLEFAEKAPGTFQHSLQVSTLATEAAKRISADVLLVRTGALYHDIGKMAHPEYFTENQQEGHNPLSEMSLEDAAHAVIAHVTDGVALAKKNKLPNVIQTFILSHHGTSKTRYFYNTWLNQHPGEKPDDSLFTYPGPKPSTKEGCILMMADAVEARSRSMLVVNPDTLSDMVEQMVGAQLTDGQFAESPLTLKDIEDIKQVFKDKLLSMNHHRITYPEVSDKTLTTN